MFHLRVAQTTILATGSALALMTTALGDRPMCARCWRQNLEGLEKADNISPAGNRLQNRRVVSQSVTGMSAMGHAPLAHQLIRVF
jgi:hypothetical protein